MKKKVNWSIKPFNELSVGEFHDIAKLRVDVFVVEQQCAYDELDGRDRGSLHFIGIDEHGTLVAYARIIPPSPKDEHVHIGRVIVEKSARGTGLGHLLMNKCMLATIDTFPDVTIALAAQSHLTEYYEKHGFKIIGKEYMWDGFPHKDMVLEK